MIVSKDSRGCVHIKYDGKEAFFQEQGDIKFIEKQLNSMQVESLNEGYNLKITDSMSCFDALCIVWKVNVMSEKEREEQLHVI